MHEKTSVIIVIKGVHLVVFHEDNILSVGQGFLSLPKLLHIWTNYGETDQFEVWELDDQVKVHLCTEIEPGSQYLCFPLVIEGE